MAVLTISNVSSSDFYLNDIYTTIPAGESFDVVRAVSEIAAMRGLQEAVVDGVLSVSVAYSADELASGLAQAAGQALPTAVLAADVVADAVVLRKAFAAGAGAVTVYAVNNLPYPIRILDAHAVVSGAATLTVSSAASAGTQAAVIVAAGAGVARASALGAGNASALLSPGSSVGLFVQRSASVSGEIVISARREYVA
jgi:hypothetical protein